MGFINPTLYQNMSSFTDITSGGNNCCKLTSGSVTCCSAGFAATAGWDPVTGLGSITFTKLAQLFVNPNFTCNVPQSPSSANGLSLGAIIGIAVGGTVALACLMGLLVCFCSGTGCFKAPAGQEDSLGSIAQPVGVDAKY